MHHQRGGDNIARLSACNIVVALGAGRMTNYAPYHRRRYGLNISSIMLCLLSGNILYLNTINENVDEYKIYVIGEAAMYFVPFPLYRPCYASLFLNNDFTIYTVILFRYVAYEGIFP